MIPALATLLVCQLIGEALVRTLVVPVPGPVVGMAGLLLLLGDEALAIGVALVLSTWIGLASAALTMAWLMKRVAPPEQRHER